MRGMQEHRPALIRTLRLYWHLTSTRGRASMCRLVPLPLPYYDIVNIMVLLVEVRPSDYVPLRSESVYA
jgi:hypothetical protein